MNTDHLSDLASHLDQREQRIKSQAAASRDSESAHATVLETLALRLCDRFDAEIIPNLEAAASFLSTRGYHALVTVGRERRDPVGNWAIVVSVKLDCGETQNPRSLHDLTFLGEVSPAEDSWRVRSFSIAPHGKSIPDETFLPGSASLASFVSARLTAFIKSALP